MGRDGASQEVSCMVALSAAQLPAFQHRKLTSSSTSAAAAAVESSGQPKDVCVPGSILEVRQLWHPAVTGSVTPVATATSKSRASSSRGDTSTSQKQCCGAALLAFVRVKDSDHRLSEWFPLQQVYVKLELAAQAFGDSAAVPTDVSEATSPTSMPAARGLAEDFVQLSRVLCRPWLNSVYEEVTPGMARTLRARRQLDYLEERLLRDCRTPTTARYFVYLNTYVFAPWYYAPFGLLNSEFDPMLPCGATASMEGDSAEPKNGSGSASGQRQPQPFIRDAYLCPFSLRVFSTYAQLHYETRAYRAGRLRPPGEEIYRDDVRGLSLFKINGSQHVTYCRQLFLIGKSFLENKLAGHDVHNYYFYVVCLHHRFFPDYVADDSAQYFAGFFTWEKQVSEYNLACIATLPCFGRRATPRPSSSTAAAHAAPPVLRNIGQFMIAASYELAYRRRQIGTPEKPLSDLGAASYQLFWRRVLVRWMKETLRKMRMTSAVDVDDDTDDNVDDVTGVADGGAHTSHGHTTSEKDVPAAQREGGDGGPDGQRAENADNTSGKAKMGRRKADAAALRSQLGGAARKRPRRSAGGDVEGDAEESRGPARRASPLPADPPVQVVAVLSSEQPTNATAATTDPAFTTRTTIKEVAAEVRLEEADVLKTLLGMGVLHRSSEDRSLQLLLPQRFVDWMYDEMLRWEDSPLNAVFQPSLLKSRGRAK